VWAICRAGTPPKKDYGGKTEKIMAGDYAAKAIMSALAILVCLLTLGCHQAQAPNVSWSEQVKSPDGIWLATARSEWGGGMGGSYDVTIVALKIINGSQPPVQILLFSHEYPTMNLKMDWLGPKHLNVKYGPSARPGDDVSIEFQAIKCAGIEISVQDVPR
jgi:hypothetical protein